MTQALFHHLNLDEVLKDFDTTPDGLSEAEAKARLGEYGDNTIKSSHRRSKFWRFVDQFRDLMVGILFVAAIVSMAVDVMNGEPFWDSIVIIAIVVLNAALGFFQEEKADEAMNALSKMQISMVKVKRDGETKEIPSREVVPGDVVVLEAGDSVPADSRLIWETSLRVDESALTGESVPVAKTLNALRTDTVLSERKNMIYSGTNIVNGRCQAVVCVTGMNTQIGLIAGSLQTVEKEITPLQQKINNIGKVLSIIILFIIAIMIIVGLMRGQPLMDALMLAVSLAVAAIPEGLSAVITVIMAIGVRDMARKRAIVKTLPSVETLGSTEIICSDKTGTITENKMRICELYFDGKNVTADKLDEKNLLFVAMALANDAEKNHQKYLGDPTEIALYECLEDYYDVDEFRDKNPRVGELPFDSERKMMTTVNKMAESGKYMVWSKGSFDSIVGKCNRVLEEDKVRKMDNKTEKKLKEVEMKESKKTYRVLAFAYRELEGELKIDSGLEENLIFLGFAAMKDAPRPDAKLAIEACKKAGIRPIMITGDSEATATAIAKEVGIVESERSVITGMELDKLDQSDFARAVDDYQVYARVSPMNKLDIVKAWRNKGKVVAMTGDGVNDAPALKAADIGVGMGVSGTDVAKAEADIVLTDDSFATIVTAVAEGRKIFDNIRNVLTYLLTGNISEVLIVVIGMFVVTINNGEIFSPLQLLYLNLITDSVPAIMLAYEKGANDIMMRPVRKNSKSFFTKFLSVRIGVSAVFKTIAVICVYLLTKSPTAAFFTLVFSEMVFAYSCRNLEAPIWKNHSVNKNLNIGMVILAVVQIVFFYTPAGRVMGLEVMNLTDTGICLVIVAVVFILDELSKPLIAKIAGRGKRTHKD